MLTFGIKELKDFKTNEPALIAFRGQLLRHKAKVRAYEMASKSAGNILVPPELIQEMQNEIESALEISPSPPGSAGQDNNFSTDEAGTIVIGGGAGRRTNRLRNELLNR